MMNWTRKYGTSVNHIFMLLLKCNLWPMFTIDRKCVGAEFQHVFRNSLWSARFLCSSWHTTDFHNALLRINNFDFKWHCHSLRERKTEPTHAFISNTFTSKLLKCMILFFRCSYDWVFYAYIYIHAAASPHTHTHEHKYFDHGRLWHKFSKIRKYYYYRPMHTIDRLLELQRCRLQAENWIFNVYSVRIKMTNLLYILSNVE